MSSTKSSISQLEYIFIFITYIFPDHALRSHEDTVYLIPAVFCTLRAKKVTLRSKVVFVEAWKGFCVYRRFLVDCLETKKVRIAQTAATEELSRLPETAAWVTGERERVAP